MTYRTFALALDATCAAGVYFAAVHFELPVKTAAAIAAAFVVTHLAGSELLIRRIEKERKQ